MPSKTLLILSQVYVPDPASVGQHMADAAAEMARRGWQVRVLTSRRGYNDPRVRYSARETIDGVDVVRLPLSSFGKRFLLLRALAAALFMAQIIVRGVFARNLGGILVSTSPPMSIAAALAIRAVRRAPLVFWVMDINPDQLVQLGKLKPNSRLGRWMDALNRATLARAARVVVLDRFMADTMLAKLEVSDKMATLPPWPHEDHLAPVGRNENPFRRAHGLDGKFVFMYSGNHGLALPLETFLRAAVRFRDDPAVRFVFVGDGVRKAEVEACIRDNHLSNMLSLPYQPLEQLRYSLSAADVHLVSMADEMVGVIHPCKIYGAMAVGRPILLLGPRPSHAADLLDEFDLGWQAPHGDVEGLASLLRKIIDIPPERLAAMGERARQAIADRFGKEHLCREFCDVVEQGLNDTAAPSQVASETAN